MKREFFEEHTYGEEKKTLNAKRHRAKRRDEIRVARAAKRGENQRIMREAEDDTSY